MSGQTSDAKYSELHQELSALRAEVTSLRGAIKPWPGGRRVRFGRFVAGLALVALLALAPLSALAANFVDLNPGSAHNNNINTIANAGITVGCTDAAHYCPNDFVTREQMASFLARTAGLGGNAPVTNAKTLQGYGASGLVRVAGAEQANNNVVTSNDTTWKSVIEVTLNIPGPGYVALNGTVVEHFTGGAGVMRARLYEQTTGQEALLEPAVADGATLSVSPTGVFTVAGSGPHTYKLQIRTGGPAWTIQGYNGQITAFYVPFGASGNTP